MDHAEARELLDLAAVEPDGFERLFAGDTPEAAALAGHLAGCDDCSAALDRTRRESAIVRDVVRTTPSPALRERTLAYVAAVGRPRGGSAGTLVLDAPPIAAAPGASAGRARFPTFQLGWVAALAAAVVIAVAGTGLFLDAQHAQTLRDRDAAIARQAEEATALARVASWTVDIGAQPDARTVELASPTGAPTRGSLVFSRTTGEVVVLAQDLAAPAAGRLYGCWVEVDGARRRVGQMFFGGGVSYWAGPVSDLASIPDGARFGVSLDPSGTEPGGDPVLVGTL